MNDVADSADFQEVLENPQTGDVLTLENDSSGTYTRTIRITDHEEPGILYEERPDVPMSMDEYRQHMQIFTRHRISSVTLVPR